ncbi:hypothetical protein GGS24DRAFT_90216 [Hypoxylon argillaceum]|nr:hypothetical protein GGS24DRAFT_90216 [Hypoxylon argillaceum]
MMPGYFPIQCRGQVTPGLSHGRDQDRAYQHLLPHAATPSKRPISKEGGGDEDDDDIQFISEKPVKRRRVSEKQPVLPMSQQPMIPFAAAMATAAIVPNMLATAMELSNSDLKDTERRLSTGMVGLPSDIHAMELTYALRGVSMPVLEKFVLNQPFRKPRPPSPPELSPKQLPSTIPPAIHKVQSSRHTPGAFGFAKSSTPSVFSPSPSHLTGQAGKPVMTPNLETRLDTGRINASGTPANPKSHATLASPSCNKSVGSKSTAMPPPRPLPCPEASHHAPCLGGSLVSSENHQRHNSSSQKQPCQVCSRLRHQAQFSRPQGLPMVKAPLSHLVPQLHCHSSYGQHLHPQMMAMPTGNVHQFGPNFASVMMPISGSSFMPLTPHPQPQPLLQQVTPQQKKGTEEDQQPPSEQSRKPESPQKPPQKHQPKSIAASPSVAPSPIKPPASLIQPTYRKPSPNLIVDVAETCQEKFPFEQVAKRHNVPVDKVFDVFAAIIQVPLLRCPTDRRRPGRLATARIKEYNRAKKDIHDSRSNESEGEAAVNSTDIAQRLGQVDFPEGFTLGSKP